MLSRCSIRLSTPPSDVARLKSLTAARTAIACVGPPASRIEHAAEAAAHLAGRDLVARMRRQAGIKHLVDGRMPLEVPGEGECGLRAARARAGTGVRMPLQEPARRTRPARRRPCGALTERTRCQKGSSRALTTAPTSASLWPFRYLVAECTTEIGAELPAASVEHRRRHCVLSTATARAGGHGRAGTRQRGR